MLRRTYVCSTKGWGVPETSMRRGAPLNPIRLTARPSSGPWSMKLRNRQGVGLADRKMIPHAAAFICMEAAMWQEASTCTRDWFRGSPQQLGHGCLFPAFLSRPNRNSPRHMSWPSKRLAML